jgi:hypothetical protein
VALGKALLKEWRARETSMKKELAGCSAARRRRRSAHLVSLSSFSSLFCQMKLILPFVGAALVAAAPPFVLQNAFKNVPTLPDLTVDDFVSIENTVKNSLKDVVEDVNDRLSALEALIANEDAVEVETHPRKIPIPHFIDLSEYTVLEIVNASYHTHHEGEVKGFRRDRKIRRSFFPHDEEENGDDDEHHKPDPKYLPLHRLAGLINFSPEAAALLEEDGAPFPPLPFSLYSQFR